MTVQIEKYKKVFQSLGYDTERSAALILRTQLLLELKNQLEQHNWSQLEAAERLGVKQPRISEIQRLRIDKFSVELLIRYLRRLDKEVEFKVRDAD